MKEPFVENSTALAVNILLLHILSEKIISGMVGAISITKPNRDNHVS
jgi:hypothetical protein